ncbi:MAG TPA: PEP/pyruvate-binding domain-containing protein [Acidimicrobiia bacterium]|nr:PEP/pyruvate-binding domain-containing protein [Acidimicrobiia bacterium]
MITSLDQPTALDPERVGAKAAALAIARQDGLPVLPGFVVESSASRPHMDLGASAFRSRGSGGARLAVSSEPIAAADLIIDAGRKLAPTLVVRSSSPLESSGYWAGAFTSYIGIAPEELPRAIAGCWASAFSVDALGRQSKVGIAPGTVPMAVLVEPAIEPDVGGVAEVRPDGSLRVEAVAGSPAGLLQGWERGAVATKGERWQGAGAIALIGAETLDHLGAVLGKVSERYGYDRCEWGLASSLWILQLQKTERHEPSAWESSKLAMVLAQGPRYQGIAAANGVGIGRRHHVDGQDPKAPPAGAVITASTALPSLSQLIWGAAGLVTDRGSPAAHVFEAARSLGVPAVCGVDLGPATEQIVAVDGYSGVVATLPAPPIP